MRPGDLLGHAHDVRARARQQLGAHRRVAAHELAVLGRERAGLQQDRVGHADLAHVVQQARVAQRLGLGRGHPQRQPEALAHPADALEVHAGLLVARLGGVRKAMDDLELRLAQLDRALAHGLLELDVAPRHAEPLAAFGGVARADRADHPQREREERHRDRQDAPVVEGALGDEQEDERDRGHHGHGHQRAQAQADQRGQEAEREHDQQAGPARRPVQWHATHHGVDRVGLDLGARHRRVARRSRVDVLQRRRCGAHHDDPPAHARGIDTTLDEVRERDGVDRPRRAVEVDPGAVLLERRGLGRVARAPRHDRGQRGQAAVRILHALEHAPRALRQVARGRLGADAVKELVAAEDIAAALVVRLGGGEHDVVGLVHGGDERVVVARRRLLGELDVVDDHPRAVAAQAVDGLRVAAPRERPVKARVRERLVVDGHDEEVRRRLRGSPLEALDDRLLIETRQQATEVGGAGHSRREDAGQQDGHGPAAPAAGDVHGA